MKLIQRIDRGLSAFETIMIVGLTLLALGMAFAQVIMRYAFNTGIHWLESALVTALVWAMLLGAVRATRDGLHPRVELVAALVPAWLRAILNFLALGAAFALSVFYLKDSYFYADFLMMIDSTHPELGIPDIYAFVIIPVITGLMAVRQIFLAIALWSDPSSHEPDRLFRIMMGDNAPRQGGVE